MLNSLGKDPTETLLKSIDNSQQIISTSDESFPMKTDSDLSLKNNEISLINIAINKTKGNISQAARLLDISFFALRRRIEKYQIKPFENSR